MHGVLVTFKWHGDPAELRQTAEAYAAALTGVRGLLLKAWLEDGVNNGGFYVFRDEATAKHYLAGDVFEQLWSSPQVRDVAVRCFDMDDELSARTGLEIAA